MDSQEKSVDPEPQEVTTETVDELIGEGAIDEEEEQDYQQYVDLTQASPDTTPERTSLKQIIKEKTSSVPTVVSSVRSAVENTASTVHQSAVDFVGSFLSRFTNASGYGTITNPTVTHSESGSDRRVKFTITSPKYPLFETSLKVSDSAYANLFEYHNISNPHNLEGVSVVKDPSEQTYYAPTNVSLAGKLRYKLFGYINHIYSKFAEFAAILFGATLISFVFGVVWMFASSFIGFPLSQVFSTESLLWFAILLQLPAYISVGGSAVTASCLFIGLFLKGVCLGLKPELTQI